MINIFDIQHFCIHDGPGIRTTVFLKGCPLHCRWCHNPESLDVKPQLLYYQDKCVQCRMCQEACPAGAHYFMENQKVGKGTKWVHVLERERCLSCGECTRVCSNRAVELSGRSVDEQELVREIQRDFPFYRNGGGVTFSGGEPLLQFDQLEKVIQDCHEKNIHTAVETSLFASRETIKKMDDTIDLVICDCKIIDSEKHRYYTGVKNTQILSNLKYLLEKRAEKTWVRTPIIPGVNDDEDNMEQMGTLLSGFPIARVELLPFHDIGLSKYLALGKEYDYKNAMFIPEQTMKQLREVLARHGINAC